jgi:hypothetical protein
MEKVKVTITKNPPFLAWYHGMIGETFEVYKLSSADDYILAEDYDLGPNTLWRHISPHECVEVQDGGQIEQPSEQ